MVSFIYTVVSVCASTTANTTANLDVCLLRPGLSLISCTRSGHIACNLVFMVVDWKCIVG
jgi:hypothetical protein